MLTPKEMEQLNNVFKTLDLANKELESRMTSIEKTVAELQKVVDALNKKPTASKPTTKEVVK